MIFNTVDEAAADGAVTGGEKSFVVMVVSAGLFGDLGAVGDDTGVGGDAGATLAYIGMEVGPAGGGGGGGGVVVVMLVVVVMVVVVLVVVLVVVVVVFVATGVPNSTGTITLIGATDGVAGAPTGAVVGTGGAVTGTGTVVGALDGGAMPTSRT
jgi:hypothetical protein